MPSQDPSMQIHAKTLEGKTSTLDVEADPCERGEKEVEDHSMQIHVKTLEGKTSTLDVEAVHSMQIHAKTLEGKTSTLDEPDGEEEDTSKLKIRYKF